MTVEAIPPRVASKLFPNQSASRPLARPRLGLPPGLLADRGRAVSLAAPAGYGKTTLMVSWARRLCNDDIPCGWLTLDADDNDDVRLLSYLIAAFEFATSKVEGAAVAATRLAKVLGRTAAHPSLARLSAAMHGVTRTTVLFLDDLQHVRAPEALKVLDWMVQHAPVPVRFVLAGREAPRLRVETLRLRGALLEIDATQLRFDTEETTRFLGDRLGPRVSHALVERLWAQTEGWAAGLQLAALTMQEGDPLEQVVVEFDGSHRSVLAYLGEVLIDAFDEDTRAFLSIAASFPRFCAELLEAAGGFSDAQERLKALDQRGLFLVALDRRGEWFRFHPLVRDHFQTGLLSTASDARHAGAALRGAAWLHRQGMIEDAIDCAIRAQAWQTACEWFAARIRQNTLLSVVYTPVARWLRAIPALWLDRYPLVLAYGLLPLEGRRRTGESDRQRAMLDRRLARAQALEADAESAAELQRAVETYRVMRDCDQDEEPWSGVEAAAGWLARWPDAPRSQRGVVQSAGTVAWLRQGRIAEAAQWSADASATLRGLDSPQALSWQQGVEALVQLSGGHYLEARRAAEHSLRICRDELGAGSAEVASLHTVRACLGYEFNELDAARRDIEIGAINARRASPTMATMQSMVQARLLFADGNVRGALARLHEGQAEARRDRMRQSEAALAAEECIWLSRLGRHAMAQAVARRYGLDLLAPSSDQRDRLWVLAQQVGARLMLSTAPQDAAHALAADIALARRLGIDHSLVKLLLLRAAALNPDTEREDILLHLAEAARIGRGNGYRRVFIDDAALLRPLLTRISSPELAGLEELLGTAPAAAPAPGSRGDAGPPDRLTAREIAILRQLDSGLSNRQVAASLFISEGTLKWHLHNIYGKLQVRNRPGALTRAKAAGLL